MPRILSWKHPPVPEKEPIHTIVVQTKHHIDIPLRTYYMTNTHTNVWESMGKPCSCVKFIKSCIYKSRENPYQYYKSRENLYQLLQEVMCTCLNVHLPECAMKSKVHTIKSLPTAVSSYTRKNITHLLPLALLLMLCTRNNTDGSKLEVFSGIALYCGDTCIIFSTSLVPCFCGNRWEWELFSSHILTGSCRFCCIYCRKL